MTGSFRVCASTFCCCFRPFGYQPARLARRRTQRARAVHVIPRSPLQWRRVHVSMRRMLIGKTRVTANQMQAVCQNLQAFLLVVAQWLVLRLQAVLRRRRLQADCAISREVTVTFIPMSFFQCLFAGAFLARCLLHILGLPFRRPLRTRGWTRQDALQQGVHSPPSRQRPSLPTCRGRCSIAQFTSGLGT
jgi:hypothetical protein